MNYTQHLFYGLIFTSIAYLISITVFHYSYNINTLILYLPIVLFYSLLPDVDSKHSIIRVIVNTFIFFLFLLTAIMFAVSRDTQYIFYFIGIFMAALIIMAMKHRGSCHSITAAVFFSLLLGLIDVPLVIFAFISYISHLIIDWEIKLI